MHFFFGMIIVAFNSTWPTPNILVTLTQSVHYFSKFHIEQIVSWDNNSFHELSHSSPVSNKKPFISLTLLWKLAIIQFPIVLVVVNTKIFVTKWSLSIHCESKPEFIQIWIPTGVVVWLEVSSLRVVDSTPTQQWAGLRICNICTSAPSSICLSIT